MFGAGAIKLIIASQGGGGLNARTAAVRRIVGRAHWLVRGRERNKPNMIHSAFLARRVRSNSPVWMILAAAWIATSSLAADSNHLSGNSKAADLTSLSLNELYNLDVVQPNVLGGHTHPAGETMVGYHYMHTHMGGIFEGTKEIPVAKAFAQGFGTVHTSMDMDMHMLDVMHAPTEWLTLMGMLPYMQMSMEHLKSDGARFSQSSEGIGDFEAMALVTVFGDIRKGGNRIVLNAGMSFPTGSINVKDHHNGDPSQPEDVLEYLMQHGSGTYDLRPGITYLGDSDKWSWGAQTIETVRLGRNDHDYRLGNEYRGSAWVAYGVTDWLAPSLRLDGKVWENITGADPALAHNTTPEGRTDLRAGGRLDFLLGLNLYVPKGMLKGNRLMVEGGFPIYQDLKGPQLGTAWMISLGWSYAF